MVTGLLTSFQIHLAENPLPSRRRQGASAKTIQGYVQDVSIFLRWWQGVSAKNYPLLFSGPIHFAWISRYSRIFFHGS